MSRDSPINSWRRISYPSRFVSNQHCIKYLPLEKRLAISSSRQSCVCGGVSRYLTRCSTYRLSIRNCLYPKTLQPYSENKNRRQQQYTAIDLYARHLCRVEEAVCSIGSLYRSDRSVCGVRKFPFFLNIDLSSRLTPRLRSEATAQADN